MKTSLPFFAKFLEAQEVEQVQGGGTMHTLKYPSDSDEGSTTITLKTYDTFHTMKYPSDGDEISTTV